jgi:hypothetical protein
MLNRSTFTSRADYDRWRRARLEGETHFHINVPEAYPCTVVWYWSDHALHYTYVYPFSPSGGRLQFGRAATEQDAWDVARWLHRSGYAVSIESTTGLWICYDDVETCPGCNGPCGVCENEETP